MGKGKWYQSRNVQAAIIGGVFLVAATVIGAYIARGPDIGRRASIGQHSTTVDTQQLSSQESSVLDRLPPGVYGNRTQIRTFPASDKPEKFLSTLRLQSRLRPLVPLEAGVPVSRVPEGTFFFLSCVSLEENEFYDRVFERANVKARADLPCFYFEAHLLADRSLRLIAFVSQESASRLAAMQDGDSVLVMLSPCFWGDFRMIASIPASRIASSSMREIQPEDRTTVNILDAKIR
jgi:hypothetical protein